MTNDEGSSNAQMSKAAGIFAIRTSSLIRHSSFGFRHLTNMKFILFLSLPLYALDQLTKQMVLRFISPDEQRVLVADFFSLVNVPNTGAAFGSFRGNNTFFIVISSLALVVVLGLLLRARAPDRWRDLSLALLLAGILGNLTDRLLYGHVIDFLLFDLHIPYAHPWPAFNVADSCISVAVVLFVIHSFWKQKSAE
jgi:signal peptidase II